jgi:membrane-bound lytic murein transglycosylase D
MLNVRNLLIINGLLISMIGLLLFCSFGGTDQKSAGGGRPAPDQTVRTIDLNREFDFCGEKFPMDNWDVRQRLDAELLRNVYLHSGTLLALKRAGALFPTIEPILKEEGVPDDLKYLAVAESVLSNAISPAGAKGVWQFMKGTGLQFGLEINEEVDERYDLEKSTRAACKYMRSQRDQLGSWVLAAAAYNGGPGRIGQDKASQRANSFFEMNLAADETMRYPFRIVAIKEVMSNPDRYEYAIDKEHLYGPMPEASVVEVSGAIPNLGDFAVQHGTTYRMLKLYNPWLLDSKLTNKAKKTYRIKVPKS